MSHVIVLLCSDQVRLWLWRARHLPVPTASSCLSRAALSHGTSAMIHPAGKAGLQRWCLHHLPVSVACLARDKLQGGEACDKTHVTQVTSHLDFFVVDFERFRQILFGRVPIPTAPRSPICSLCIAMLLCFRLSEQLQLQLLLLHGRPGCSLSSCF